MGVKGLTKYLNECEKELVVRLAPIRVRTMTPMHNVVFFHFLGLWKKLLAVTVFLAIASVVCALMLAPSSPYVKAKCRANSIKGHSLTFKFYPKDSDVRVLFLLERFPIKCRRIKTKVTITANQSERKYYREPIRMKIKTS